MPAGDGRRSLVGRVKVREEGGGLEPRTSRP